MFSIHNNFTSIERPRVLLFRTIFACLAACLLTLLPATPAAFAQSTYSVTHQFGDGSVENDGNFPHSALVKGADGNFYGTTQQGGSTVTNIDNGYGTAFKITPAGVVTILHNFGDGSVANDGVYPTSALTLGADGNFYGTTLCSSDNSGAGDVFRMSPAGVVSTVYEFSATGGDGNNPTAPLILGADGNFYGTTSGGGSAGAGILFRMSAAGVETILHNFGDGSVNLDGAAPGQVVQQSDGSIVGVTSGGGTAQHGTLFKYSPISGYSILHNFGDGSVINDGAFPNGIVLSGSGTFVGTSLVGGNSTNSGTIFTSTSSGAISILHAFNQASDGYISQPQAGMIQASDGNYYGTTPGAVYSITPSGTLTVLHTFGSVATHDGYNPQSPLIEGNDGAVYGTTAQGGSTDILQAGTGSAFKIALGLPGNLLAPSITSITAAAGQISLAWSAVNGATSYNVLRSTSSRGEGNTPVYSGLTTTTKLDTGLINGVTYYYKVQASNAAQTSPNSAEASATPQVADPNIPAALTASSSSGQVSLSWTAAAGATSYNVYRGSASGAESATPEFAGLTGTTKLDSTVSNGSTYYYIVKAVNSGGTSAASNEVSASPQVATPAVPANLVATATPGQVSLTWATASGATSYSIYRGTSPGAESVTALFAGLTSTSKIDLSVSNGTTYYYVVKSVNNAGSSMSSNEAVATPQVAIPSVPTGLTASAGNGQVTLTWSPSTGASFYIVYRGTASGAENTTPLYSGVTTTTKVDASATNGVTYYYLVKAINNGGCTSASNEADATPQVPIPGSPTGLTATGGPGQVSLAWSASPGATIYIVYRGTATGAENTTPIYSGITTTTKVDSTVNNGTTYYYLVKAINNGGCSSASNEASATPQVAAPSTPVGLTASGGNGQVSLTWTATAGASSYSVYRGTAAGSESATPVYSGVSNTAKLDTSVTNGTAYYYVVKAVNNGGNSPASNEASATPQVPVPGIPTGLTAVAGNGQVSLSWTASAGASIYIVYRGTAAGAENTTPIYSGLTTTTKIDASVTNGTTYYYLVKAVNNGGCSSASNEASATPQVAVPGVPSGLTASAANGQVSLSWGLSAGASFYIVYRGTVSGEENTTPIYSGVLTTTKIDSSVTNGTTYYYLVKAVNNGGTSNASNEASATPELPVASAPTNLTAVGGAGEVTLSWTASANAATYDVYRGSDTGAESSTPVYTGLAATTKIDTGLAGGTKYYYIVRAINSSGASASSNEASASTAAIIVTQSAPLTAPSGLTATAGSASVTLTWQSSTGAASYNIYRGNSPGSESATPVYTGVTSTSKVDTSVTSGTVYYYTAKAVSGSAVSNSSNEAWAVTASAAPLAPKALFASTSGTSISLMWTPSTGATSYQIFRSLTKNDPSPMEVYQGLTTTYKLDSGLLTGRTYYYTVKAANAGGVSPASPQASAMP